MSQPQTQTHLPCCLVAFENKSGEKAGRTMLDCQRIRQSQVVFRDNIGVDEGHDHLLSIECGCDVFNSLQIMDSSGLLPLTVNP
jgi:hypothetical protein